MEMLRLFIFALLIAGAAACDPVEGIPRKYGTDEPTDTGTGTDSVSADDTDSAT